MEGWALAGQVQVGKWARGSKHRWPMGGFAAETQATSRKEGPPLVAGGLKRNGPRPGSHGCLTCRDETLSSALIKLKHRPRCKHIRPLLLKSNLDLNLTQLTKSGNLSPIHCAELPPQPEACVPMSLCLTPLPFLPPPEEVLPVGIIAGATIGAGILLIFFFIALVFFLYRRRKGSECGPHEAAALPSHPRAHSRQRLPEWGGVGV